MTDNKRTRNHFMKYLITLMLMNTFAYAQNLEPLEIFIDADFSNHFESSDSIKKGFETALRTIDSTIHGRKIIIKELDHRGNSKRSKRNIRTYLNSSNAIAMVSGIHSPPLLAHKNFINENEVLFLVPWAAAGPITRSKDNNNWIFRLSIDDTKAGGFLASYAVKNINPKISCLLLENTGWGKSNFKNITQGLEKLKKKVQHTKWFDWGIKKNVANEVAVELSDNKCDLIYLVANAKEGAKFITAISKLSSPIPIISHWGITGGDFHKNVSHKTRQKVNLKFIQTKFNFNSSKLDSFQKNVLAEVVSNYKDVNSAKDIKASTGFIHAYDLGLIFVDAIKRTKKTNDIKALRKEVKKRLENSITNVRGLLKTYSRPFSPYSKSNFDAHEALNVQDYTIGIYDKHGDIVNIK